MNHQAYKEASHDKRELKETVNKDLDIKEYWYWNYQTIHVTAYEMFKEIKNVLTKMSIKQNWMEKKMQMWEKNADVGKKMQMWGKKTSVNSLNSR